MILRDTFTKWNGESWKPCVLKSGRSKWLYLTWRTASGDSTGFSNIERAVRRKPEKFVCVLPWTARREQIRFSSDHIHWRTTRTRWWRTQKQEGFVVTALRGVQHSMESQQGTVSSVKGTEQWKRLFNQAGRPRLGWLLCNCKCPEHPEVHKCL